MSVQKYLSTLPALELDFYYPDEHFRDNAVAFRGAPRRHPYDPGKLLLIPSPTESPSSFYEFKSADIVHAEVLRSITTENGQTLQLYELWIKKGSLGMLMRPFSVGDDPVRDRLD
ncbi:MAG: hypothetical protein ACLFPW_14705 [Spirochaetaceae bacterium]